MAQFYEPGSGSADTDVTRYEIENKENMINANDKRVIFFINFSSNY